MAQRSPPGRQRVLLVDDDATLRRAIGRLIATRYEVVEAADGDEALELLAKGPAPSAILCDLAMPRVSGADVYRALQLRHPELAQRFVLFTGGGLSDEQCAFVDGGEVPVLHKPCARDELLGILATVTLR